MIFFKLFSERLEKTQASEQNNTFLMVSSKDRQRQVHFGQYVFNGIF